MRTVFTGDMVFHVWANQSAPHGRRSDGRVFFEGRTLYSYGHHFALGHVMPDGVTLLNADSYSISTSKHQSQARWAVSGRTLAVPSLTDLCRDTWSPLACVEKLAQPGRSDRADLRERATRGILAYTSAHALGLTDESAAYLLGLIGRARSWPKIHRDAEAAAAKAKADAAARELANKRERARQIADLSDSDWAAYVAEHVARREGQWIHRPFAKRHLGNHVTESEATAELARDVHGYARAAKGQRPARVYRVAWSRYQALRATVKRLEKWGAHASALTRIGRLKHALRATLGELDSGTLSRTRNRELSATAAALLSFPYHGALIKRRADLQSVYTAANEREESARREEERERFEREAAARADWLAGGGERWTRLSDELGGSLLRAVDVTRDESGNVSGGTLQTGWGADVPLTHALKAFRFVKRVRATGAAWQANGHTIRVGHFRVDSIAADGTMHAGCHVIHWGEMERVAAGLGVADLGADDSALEPSHAAA